MGKEFNIHAAQLQKLSTFFDVEASHGSREKVHDVSTKRARTEASSDSKDDNGVKVEDDGSSTETGEEPREVKKRANYYLPHVRADAFTTFTQYLYNKHPRRPRNLDECKILIRSYALALQYQVAPLQNKIVDCLRQFHQEVDFNIDMFAYLMNRVPDPNKLMDYFIAQMAYDIAHKGWEEFKENNMFILYFIADYSRPLRLQFVEELARHAHEVRRLKDPSNLTGCKWHDHNDTSNCVEDDEA